MTSRREQERKAYEKEREEEMKRVRERVRKWECKAHKQKREEEMKREEEKEEGTKQFGELENELSVQMNELLGATGQPQDQHKYQ